MSDNSVKKWAQSVTNLSETVLPVEKKKKKSTFALDINVLVIFRELPVVGSLGGNQHGLGGEHEQQHFLQVLTGLCSKNIAAAYRADVDDDLIKKRSLAHLGRYAETCALTHGCKTRPGSLFRVPCKSSEKWGREAGVRRQIYCSV